MARTPRTVPTALLAVVGVGDLAVEKMRDARAQAPAAAQQRVADLQVVAHRSVAATQQAAQQRVTAVRSVPGQLRGLPAQGQARVSSAVDQAADVYKELAGRGQHLLSRIRHQDATQELEHQARDTATQARATATSARAATDITGVGANATRTSARTTASAARTAAAEAAEQVGD